MQEREELKFESYKTQISDREFLHFGKLFYLL